MNSDMYRYIIIFFEGIYFSTKLNIINFKIKNKDNKISHMEKEILSGTK